MSEQTDALDRLIAAVEAGEFDAKHPKFNAFVNLAEVAMHCVGDPALTAFRAYKGTLDAAMALHEAMLPGWEWGVMSQPDGEMQPGAFVARADNSEAGFEASSPVPARAWLLAVLKAYRSTL